MPLTEGLHKRGGVCYAPTDSRMRDLVSVTMRRSPEYHRFASAYEYEARLLAEEDAAKELRKKIRRKSRPSK
jgi:hypothetical protein